jgi:hypothetical protein
MDMNEKITELIEDDDPLDQVSEKDLRRIFCGLVN